MFLLSRNMLTILYKIAVLAFAMIKQIFLAPKALVAKFANDGWGDESLTSAW